MGEPVDQTATNRFDDETGADAPGPDADAALPQSEEMLVEDRSAAALTDEEFDEDEEDRFVAEAAAANDADAASEAVGDAPTATHYRAVDAAGEPAGDAAAALPESTQAVAEVGGVDPRAVLDTLHERPLAEHAEVYEELHTHLQRTLAEIDGG